MANVVKVIENIVKHTLSKVRSLRLDEIVGDKGARLYSKNGKWWYGTSELGTASEGSSCLWEDNEAGTVSLTSGADVSAGSFDFRTTGYFTVATSNQLNIGHDGGDAHEIVASDTGGLKIQTINGGLYLSTGGSATLNGNPILTDSWSGSVSAGGNTLSDIYVLNFDALGGIIQNDGTAMMNFDSDGIIYAMTHIDMNSARVKNIPDTPTALTDAVNANYVQSQVGVGTYLPLSGGAMTGNIGMSDNHLNTNGGSFYGYENYATIEAYTGIKMFTNSGYPEVRIQVEDTYTRFNHNIDMNNNDVINVGTIDLEYGSTIADNISYGILHSTSLGHAFAVSSVNKLLIGSTGVDINDTLDMNDNTITDCPGIGSGGDFLVVTPNGYNFQTKTATGATLTYPNADGTSGQAIITDGSGNFSFGDVSSPLSGNAVGDINMGSYALKNSSGALTLKSSTGTFVFVKGT